SPHPPPPPNDSPHVDTIPDIVADFTEGTYLRVFLAYDTETPNADLTFTVRSSNPAVLPSDRITIDRSTAPFIYLRVQSRDLLGTDETTITVAVTDTSRHTSTVSFRLIRLFGTFNIVEDEYTTSR